MSDRPHKLPRRQLPGILATTALLWCTAVGIVIWVVPVGSSVSSSSGGSVTSRGLSFSEISDSGPVPLLVPAALAGLATWAGLSRRRTLLLIATAAVAVYAFVTGFSIGATYVPAVVLLVAACALSRARASVSGE